MKKQLTIICMSVISAGLLLAGCDKPEPPKKEVVRPVKSMVIQSRKSKILRSFPGKILPNQETTVAFQVKGRVNDFNGVVGVDIGENPWCMIRVYYPYVLTELLQSVICGALGAYRIGVRGFMSCENKLIVALNKCYRVVFHL